MQQLIKMFPENLRNYYRPQWHQIKLEILIALGKIKRQFLRPISAKNKNGEIYLHLGCGSINNPDFINVDGMPFPHVHYVREINDLSPFKNESIDLIYASHCLEHFSHIQISSILSEWFEKLKPGGILRLSVPDFDQLIHIYLENNKDVSLILSPLMGGQSNKFDFHKIVFNCGNLKQLLINAGFHEVREWHPSFCNPGDFDDWSNRQLFINGKYYSVSLNLEAVK
ncbi:MAG: methyltransferase domain-containing protein [Dolichospermum sp. DET50]|nr:methyltransferase domain-containing protein [Dolichospermum sp. DET66]MBS3035085.1 methyltransferase domain-containing protein [Dolichospermum sp. DET67]MBS3040285.1 methyltransferase domain-containing protein [Dolichospermum sp. DET50]QSX67443.1 MAG: methyltransferase domain-containing protein [Dolichospermum sp. DET69]